MTGNDLGMREALRLLALNRQHEDAWRNLFKYAWPLMVTLSARLLGGDAAEAQDAAQEALIRLARYAPFEDLQEPAAFRAYTRTVCRRVVHKRYRDRGAKLFLPTKESEMLASDDLDPEQETSAVMLFETILGELNPEDQRLLRMTVAGCSLEEIAEHFGITYEAAAVRVHRVHKRIRKWVQYL